VAGSRMQPGRKRVAWPGLGMQMAIANVVAILQELL
jgi:hypothetical protein